MIIKKLITDTLRNTKVPNIDKMLQYMEKCCFYDARCSSHDHWRGGTAQHSWAVYLMAKALRDQRKSKDSKIAKYATDEKLAIVCLLHDLCDMSVIVKTNKGDDVSHRHGPKSYWMMKNLNVGTEVERMVVRYHNKRNKSFRSTNQDEIDEYEALHGIILDADHFASSTAWNKVRFRESRTQHLGVHTEDHGYLMAVAMDRTVQSGKRHMYMDEEYNLWEYRNYNRNKINWDISADILSALESKKEISEDEGDCITSVYMYSFNTGHRCCLVVGVDANIPKDKDTRLRRGWRDEQSVFICSNLLNTFYESNECKEKKGRHRFEFTMRYEIKERYRKLQGKEKCIFLPEVGMIRHGWSRGLPFVEPWKVDILLVPGKRFPMFVVHTSIVTNSI